MARTPTEIDSMTLAGLNLIKQALSIYDSDLRLVVANLQFQKMFDLPDHLMQIGAHFDETLAYLARAGEYGDIVDIDDFIAERTTQARAFVPHYFERTRANGTTISVEGSPLRMGGWVAVYTDITEVKRQEALLRERSTHLSQALILRSEELSAANRALTASVTALEEAKRDLTASQAELNLTNAMTPAHIARVNRDGYYTYSNRKLGTILPGRSSDVIGLHFSAALGQDVWEIVRPSFAQTLDGTAPVLEFEHRDSGRHLRIAFTPDKTGAGTVIGAYLLSMDVTDEVNARHALTHARRRELAAQLTSGLAHDFSNLLTIILGQQDRLARLPNLPPDIAAISDTIKSAAKRGGDLLEGLSRFDARRRLTPQPVNLPRFVDAIEQLAKAATPEGVTLAVENGVAETSLSFDPGFAQDALLNLVLNAVEAMNGPGNVTVTISRAGAAHLEMTVRDTGPGFSDDALRNAFAPFYTSKTGKPGRGLGLSTAFDYAKTSGGTIHLQNHPNGGAIVTLRIPYRAVAPAQPGMVLLVEDQLEIRETVRGYLRAMGHSVIEAGSIAEAQKLARMAGVTHLITDLMLGETLTGLDLARDLRSTGFDRPILIITGLDAANPLRQAAEAEFALLHKPFDRDSLHTALQPDANP